MAGKKKGKRLLVFLSGITILVLVVTLLFIRVTPEKEELAAAPVLKPGISAEIDDYIKAYESKGWFSGSALVAKSGEILLDKGYGMANYELGVLNTSDTRFHLGSVTKQFTAMAVMQLQEKGKLSTEDNLAKYIPDYPNGKKITIHQLLTHTSGIPDYINDDKTFEDISRLYHPLDYIIGRFKNKPLEFQPGTKYDYSNSGYVLLCYIIESVSKMKYQDYLSTYIFKLLGMNNTGYDDLKPLVKKRAQGYTIIDGKLYNVEYFDRSNLEGADGLFSTTGDLYKWDRALYTDKLVTKETLNKIFTPYPPAKKYGYGWVTDGVKMYHTGRMDGFYTCISRDIKNDYVIILLSNLQQAPVVNMNNDLEAILSGKNCSAPSNLTSVVIDME